MTNLPKNKQELFMKQIRVINPLKPNQKAMVTRSLPVFLTEASTVSLSQGINVLKSMSSQEIPSCIYFTTYKSTLREIVEHKQCQAEQRLCTTQHLWKKNSIIYWQKMLIKTYTDKRYMITRQSIIKTEVRCLQIFSSYDRTLQIFNVVHSTVENSVKRKI